MNGDTGLRYPKWEREFRDVVGEFDRRKLMEKMQKFEAAVFMRIQELESDADHHDERQAIADATSGLCVKRDKLGVSGDSAGLRRPGNQA